MSEVDLGLRAAAIGLLVLWALLLWRDAGERLGAVFALGVASYAVCSAPGFPVTWMPGWHLPLLMLCVGNPLLFWLFARRLFDDNFIMSRHLWVAWAAYASAGTVGLLGLLPGSTAVAGTVLSVGTFAFALLAARAIWRGFRDDLVEQRRRIRPLMMGGAVLYALAMAITEIGNQGLSPNNLLSTVNALILAAFTFLTLYHFTKGAGSDLFQPTGRGTARADPLRVEAILAPDQLVGQLDRLFTKELIHRDPDLSLGRLAARMDVPEYRLRAAINQALGYRNFAAFVNSFRLTEAQSALTDPEQANVPISTIAFDAGFGSLGAFNRCFKEVTGATPSEYRQDAQR